MKKINNKGFAISVLIYSLGTIALLTLLIILGTLSGMRKNESTLVDSVKQELNEMSRRVNVYGYKENIQVYRVPTAGNYTFKLWGASGGSPITRKAAGLGGYVSLTYYLEVGKYVYIIVGDEGNCSKDGQSNNFASEFSTGGRGNCIDTLNTYVCGCNGGGASIVAVGNSATPPSDINAMTLIAVAGGGGGAGQKGGNGGNATGLSPAVDGTREESFGVEQAAGNYYGTSAVGSTPGRSIGPTPTDIVETAASTGHYGGSFIAPYNKFAGVSWATSDNGYPGAGGGGGYRGGGAASGSYSGAGGGSNYTYVTNTDVVNLSGGENLPKKDLTEGFNTSYEDKKGPGQVIVIREG